MKIIRGSLTIRILDDMHSHYRELPVLRLLARLNQLFFARAIDIGNTVDPIDNAEKYNARNKLLKNYAPKMQIKLAAVLTRTMKLHDIDKIVHAGGQYLKILSGSTTNSDQCVQLEEIEKYFSHLERAEKRKMKCLIHGEITHDTVTGLEIPEKDKEFQSLPIIKKIAHTFPGLPLYFAHLSDRRSIGFVNNEPGIKGVGATPQHFLYTKHDVYDKKGGLKNPHLVLKPCLKEDDDRQAIRNEIFSGNKKYYLETDNAPHSQENKLKIPPSYGSFSLFQILNVLETFNEHGKLDKFEPFVSENGANCHGWPLNQGEITFTIKRFIIPKQFVVKAGGKAIKYIPLGAGQEVKWSLKT